MPVPVPVPGGGRAAEPGGPWGRAAVLGQQELCLSAEPRTAGSDLCCPDAPGTGFREGATALLGHREGQKLAGA